MGKKGLSLEEKKEVIIQILQKEKRPFLLKDLEKLASKAGVVQNTVKDVTKELVDDNRIDMDKIGASNWFWSFPSKESTLLRSKITDLQTKSKKMEEEKKQLKERYEELLKDRPESEQRVQKILKLETLKGIKAEKEAYLKKVKENDPTEVRKIQAACTQAKLASERWTDNTWATMDWMKKSMGIMKQDAMKHLQITEDFDYPVYKRAKTQ